MSTQRIGNLGIAPGAIDLKNIVRGILLQTFADDGSRNVIDFTGGEKTLTKVELELHLVDPDISKRWHLLPAFNDADLPKSDTVLDTAPDGTNFRVRDGIRSATIMMKAQDSGLLKGLTTGECGGVAEWSVFFIDKCGVIVTEEVDLDIGRPLEIAKSTFDSIYHFANNTIVNDVTINFDIDKFFRDEDITPVAVDADADILRAVGVVPVNMAISAITTTGFIATGTFDTGFLGDKALFTGAVAADFDLNELSPAPGTITITTVVETPALSGIYVFVIPTQDTDDVLELTSSATGVANKFEMRAEEILIP